MTRIEVPVVWALYLLTNVYGHVALKMAVPAAPDWSYHRILQCLLDHEPRTHHLNKLTIRVDHVRQLLIQRSAVMVVQSSQGQALIQSIVENPANDAARLNFADWLNEHGDSARALFIRVQIERAQLAKDDPRQSELAVQEQALLSTHEAAWRRELPPWVYYAHFQRGFAAEVGASAQDFARGAAELYRAAPVEAISVTCDNFASLEALASSPYLGRITELHVTETGLGDYAAEVLVSSPYLKSVKSLSWISEDENRALGDRGVAVLATAPVLRSLCDLCLISEKIGDAGVAALATSPGMTNLTSLRLEKTQFSDAGLTALASSTPLVRLTTLRLYFNQIRDAGTQALAVSPLLRRLTWLDLSMNGIGNAGVEALAASPYAVNLRWLTLWGNDLIGDPGGLALAASPYLTDVIQLELAVYTGLVLCHQIGPVGQDALRARFGKRVAV